MPCHVLTYSRERSIQQTFQKNFLPSIDLGHPAFIFALALLGLHCRNALRILLTISKLNLRQNKDYSAKTFTVYCVEEELGRERLRTIVSHIIVLELQPEPNNVDTLRYIHTYVPFPEPFPFSEKPPKTSPQTSNNSFLSIRLPGVLDNITLNSPALLRARSETSPQYCIINHNSSQRDEAQTTRSA
jgi:hypothetical protein